MSPAGEEMETVLALSRKAAEHLQKLGIENARLEAELMLAAVLGIERLQLYLQFDRPLTAHELEQYRASVRRRVKREPVQYILGDVVFRELTLRVDRRVLIPRPETEVLAGVVLRWARERGDALAAADIGTGSGAIALSLAHEGPFARVVATDVSPDALDVARANARITRLEEKVEFRQGATWDAFAGDERFDVIVSNPPYVAESESAQLAPEVREWEPAVALFGAGDGFAVLNDIVDGAAQRLVPGGLLALEVGVTQAQRVAARAAGRGFEKVSVVKDYAGRERIVLASKSEGETSHA